MKGNWDEVATKATMDMKQDSNDGDHRILEAFRIARSWRRDTASGPPALRGAALQDTALLHQGARHRGAPAQTCASERKMTPTYHDVLGRRRWRWRSRRAAVHRQ